MKVATKIIVTVSSTTLLFLLQTQLVLAQASVRDSAPVASSSDVQGASQQVAQPALSKPAIPQLVVNTTALPVVTSLTETNSQAVNNNGEVRSSNLAYQVQQLLQEVLELRGLVEEQSFEMRRLKQQRLDDYLDLDKRLTELNQKTSKAIANASVSKTSSFSASSSTSLSTMGSPKTITNVNTINKVDDKTLYREAIDFLLNKQDYPAAKKKFSQYLVEFPEGTYVPNAFYWQGQIFLAQRDKNSAEQSFKALVEKFPKHQKTPDAKYKLATIYFDQGKKTEAKTLLDEVVASDADASRLAKSFLSNQF